MNNENCEEQNIKETKAYLRKRLKLLKSKNIPTVDNIYNNHGENLGNIVLKQIKYDINKMDEIEEPKISFKNDNSKNQQNNLNIAHKTDKNTIDHNIPIHERILHIGAKIERKYEKMHLLRAKKETEELLEFERFEYEKHIKLALENQKNCLLNKLRQESDTCLRSDKYEKIQKKYENECGKIICNIIMEYDQKINDLKLQIQDLSKFRNKKCSLTNDNNKSTQTENDENLLKFSIIKRRKKNLKIIKLIANNFKKYFQTQKFIYECNNTVQMIHLLCSSKFEFQKQMKIFENNLTEKFGVIQNFLENLYELLQDVHCKCDDDDKIYKTCLIILKDISNYWSKMKNNFHEYYCDDNAFIENGKCENSKRNKFTKNAEKNTQDECKLKIVDNIKNFERCNSLNTSYTDYDNDDKTEEMKIDASKFHIEWNQSFKGDSIDRVDNESGQQELSKIYNLENIVENVLNKSLPNQIYETSDNAKKIIINTLKNSLNKFEENVQENTDECYEKILSRSSIALTKSDIEFFMENDILSSSASSKSSENSSIVSSCSKSSKSEYLTSAFDSSSFQDLEIVSKNTNKSYNERSKNVTEILYSTCTNLLNSQKIEEPPKTTLEKWRKDFIKIPKYMVRIHSLIENDWIYKEATKEDFKNIFCDFEKN